MSDKKKRVLFHLHQAATTTDAETLAELVKLFDAPPPDGSLERLVAGYALDDVGAMVYAMNESRTQKGRR